MLTLHSPDFSELKIDSRHLRLIEERDKSDTQATHRAYGFVGGSRIFVAGQIWVCRETPAEIRAMLPQLPALKPKKAQRRIIDARKLPPKF